ncbi:hypothetical protein K0M31_007152 [Melipona bicolor]|uniref:Uncharacterized protein n=1 Tax=Melipona bicolor TaxID=60889 RepID=A0AA40FS30_9HYME|nr:hypothetical protein K0M31_007152 [Melipona bicolor]
MLRLDSPNDDQTIPDANVQKHLMLNSDCAELETMLIDVVESKLSTNWITGDCQELSRISVFYTDYLNEGDRDVEMLARVFDAEC